MPALRLTPAPVKSILYIETRVDFPKIYKLDQVIDLLKMLWLVIRIQIKPTLVARLKRKVAVWLLPDSASPLLLVQSPDTPHAT